jgi:hypothetical protein
MYGRTNNYPYLCNVYNNSPMTKSNYDIIHQMRDDIIATYREVAPKCWSQHEAWEKIARHPAPRFYISAKQAHDKLRKMAVGDFAEVDKMSPEKRRMYYTLYERMQEMAQKKEMIGKSLNFMCPFLVGQPAPEFYLSPQTVGHIFNNCKRHGKEYRETEIRGISKRKDKSNTDGGNADVPTDV